MGSLFCCCCENDPVIALHTDSPIVEDVIGKFVNGGKSFVDTLEPAKKIALYTRRLSKQIIMISESMGNNKNHRKLTTDTTINAVNIPLLSEEGKLIGSTVFVQ